MTLQNNGLRQSKIISTPLNWNENFSALKHDSYSGVDFSGFEICVVLSYVIWQISAALYHPCSPDSTEEGASH